MRKLWIMIVVFSIGMGALFAQSAFRRLGKEIMRRSGQQVERRVEQKAEEGVEKAMDKTEDVARKAAGKEEKVADPDEGETDGQVPDSSRQEKVSLRSVTQYDFVPGDKILFYDDFSQDAIGDFPALWTTNGSGEVKTVNIAPGNWLHMNGEDAVYCLLKRFVLPDNFIVEFDIIPDEEYQYGIQLTLYEETEAERQDMNDGLYPASGGLHIRIKPDGWETRGYINKEEKDPLDGKGHLNPVRKSEVNHVIIWIQKRRVRIYHLGNKVMDMPTNIYPETVFNRIRFSGWDAYSHPYITNLKITTASPDTRNKLLEEGKLISYGIYFDVNSDIIKPESRGALADIAKTVREAGVQVRVVGHTDNSGQEGSNLDLSRRRAASIKVELVKMGVPAESLSTDGAGASRPIAPNDTPSNKALNRRVEFIKL